MDLECSLSRIWSAAEAETAGLALANALILFAPTLQRVRCVDAEDSVVLDVVGAPLEDTFGSSLGSESIPDVFLDRASLSYAVEDVERHDYRLKARRDTLRSTLEFGGRMLDQAERNRDFGAMEELFRVLGPLKGLQLIRAD